RLLWLWPVLLLGIIAPVVQALLSALAADFPTPRPSLKGRLALRVMTALMHLMQPLARLVGRLSHGLTPWRKRICIKLKFKWLYNGNFWSEQWSAPQTWLENLVKAMLLKKIPAVQGGDYDPWDIEVRGGLIGLARLQLAVEEHGGGKQMLRFRILPRFSRYGVIFIALFTLLGYAALTSGARVAAIALFSGSLLMLARAASEYFLAANALSHSMCLAWNTAGHDDECPERHKEPEKRACAPVPSSNQTV
ncbi:MAG TPA: hypothetical protein VLL07_01820, partial [Pontiella sp.]|nr:hypothetical protein [Pontiella sp.]